MKHFKAVAAMSKNRVIGNAGKIPWYLPEDFKWFKQLTTGHTLVMGRKTFESIGRPLPNRTTVVISRRGLKFDGTETITDLALVEPSKYKGDVFIAGGSNVYAQSLPLCSDLYLTLVDRDVEGDSLFPPFESDFDLVEEVASHKDFKILHYKNKHLT
jgi:dihydrofolate reductase